MDEQSLELIQALNAAAAILQKTSLSEAAVFSASRDEIARLGFRGGLSILDETGENLVVKSTVQPEWMVTILDNLEKRTGYKARGYSFPYSRVSVYRKVIETHKAVFVSDSSMIISQMLPETIRPFADVITKALGSPPGIYAPLNKQGRTIGVLNILGRELKPDDLPAVEAFANHIVIALENARLFEALRDSQKTAMVFQERMRALHEVNFELAAIESLDGLYYSAIEVGLRKLGFERLALFLIEEDGKNLLGTYGTDENGLVRDERWVRREISETSNKFILEWLKNRTRSTHMKDVILQGAGRELDRTGSNVLAIVWDGNQAIGMLATDNYLTQRPLQSYTEDFLSMYGNIIGHLISRIRNEQALRVREERYRVLFEESPISIWEEDFSLVKKHIDALKEQGVTDFHRYFTRHPEEVRACAALVRVRDVNKAAMNVYHAEGKEEMLESLSNVIDSEISLTGFQRELVASANGETSLNFESTNATLKGTPIEVSLNWRVVPGHESDLSRVIISIVDITDRKRIEREHEKLIADLEAKNAELERFAYTISHDLKSPLVTINGFLGYIEKDATTGNLKRLRQDSYRIQESVNKMHRLLNELLELSRIGRMMNPPEIISFDELVEDALKFVHGRLEESGTSVHAHPNLPAVFGDRQRLTEVLQNLIDNAAKYMGDQSEPFIEIGQQGEEEGKPIFFVRDNGIGITPEHYERVFGLFNKLDPNSEGTGVGLALVKRIIEFHGGRIWVESEGVGRGSTFCFTLPRGG